MIRIKVECEGISPLLMNGFSEEKLLQLRSKTLSPRIAEKIPEKEAEEKIYKDNDGKIGIPAHNLFSCLIEAGRLIKLDGKRSISTATSSLLPSFLEIEEPFFPLEDGGKWQVDVRRGRNPRDGSMICLVRPIFHNWPFSFTLRVDEKQINEDKVKQLVEYAGSRIGLCDFRPARRGPFGRFTIKHWKRIKSKEN